MSNTIDLALDGLSCGHCVKRVKESLEQRPDVEQAEVTVTEAHVTGSASAEALIETIKQAGYGAELSHPKAKPLAESSIPPEALTAATTELPAARDEDDSQQLLINGMSCASCVSRVQNALAAVPGVSQARVNLAERTALVMGSASAAELVQAVEKAGYGAEAIEDDLERRERQQETAVATMKRFRWQAGDVKGVPYRAKALRHQRLRRLVRARLGAVVDDDLRAVLRQAAGQQMANPLSGSGDQRALP